MTTSDMVAFQVAQDKINAELNGRTFVDVPCDGCGEWHYCQTPMTPTQKRAANRKRVAKGLFVDSYTLYAVAEDAWTRERVNLTALLRKEII